MPATEANVHPKFAVWAPTDTILPTGTTGRLNAALFTVTDKKAVEGTVGAVAAGNATMVLSNDVYRIIS